MKTAIALITAALTATSAQAWGEREQGILAGIVGTIVLQQISKDGERPQREQQPPVVIREQRPAFEPHVWRGWRPPMVVIQDTFPQIICPQGTAEFYVLRHDRHGRPFYLFDGCR